MPTCGPREGLVETQRPGDLQGTLLTSEAEFSNVKLIKADSLRWRSLRQPSLDSK